MYYNDIEDAYQVILLIADVQEGDSQYEKTIRSNWEKALRQAQAEIFDSSMASKIRTANHGRVPEPQYLNNPVVVGKTKENNLIALDGSHRIIEHLNKQSQRISVIIVDISWLDDADCMEF